MFVGYRDAVLIGEGGLGRVYRAVRESTGGIVAVKELREIPSASPAWHRAKRELEAMLRLKGHPYVVSIEEIIESEHGPCLVMEYLEGGSLMQRLAQSGPLSTPELILVGQHVTQALAAAHAVGIVHRDIKPHNLLVGGFGQVKVADFGIAALTRDAGAHTRTQAFTLAYASPEELDGESDIGPPADMYSFAATISHLATGRKPSFRERSVVADLGSLLGRHDALTPVVAVLLQCLADDPNERPSATTVHQTFTRAMSRLGAEVVTQLAIEPSTSPAISLAVASSPPPPPPPPPPAPPPAPAPSSSQLLEADATVIRGPHTPKRRVSEHALPEADRTIVRSRAGAAPRDWWARGGRCITTLVGHGDVVNSAVFSPDGTRVLSAGWDGTARVWDLSGRQLHALSGHGDTVWFASYDNAGDMILTASEDRTARLWDAQGRCVRVIGGADDSIWSAVFDRVGQGLLTVGSDGSVMIRDLAGRVVSMFPTQRMTIYSAEFSPDGTTVVTGDADGTVTHWDLDGRILGRFLGHVGAISTAVFGPDGDTILSAGEDMTARLWDLDGHVLMVLSGHTNSVSSAAFSHDGNHIITAGEDGTARIWDLDGAEVTILRGHGEAVGAASFSPDDQLIVTASDDGTARIWSPG